jgi:predicted permease
VLPFIIELFLFTRVQLDPPAILIDNCFFQSIFPYRISAFRSSSKFRGIDKMGFAAIRDVFINNLLPVLLCAAAGFTLGKTMKLEIKTASRMAFHIFSPCLIFVSLTHVELSGGEFGRLAFFTFAVSIVIGGLAFIFGKMLRAERHLLASLVVSSMFVNGGNYGLAATKFSFGEAALARALVCFVSGTVIIYTLGVLIASMGKMSGVQALKQVLRVPAIYALVAAGLVLRTGWRMPLFLDRSISLLGDASIPLMLVIFEHCRATKPS